LGLQTLIRALRELGLVVYSVTDLMCVYEMSAPQLLVKIEAAINNGAFFFLASIKLEIAIDTYAAVNEQV